MGVAFKLAFKFLLANGIEKEGCCPGDCYWTESLRTATKSASAYEAAREEVCRVSRGDEKSSETETADDRRMI